MPRKEVSEHIVHLRPTPNLSFLNLGAHFPTKTGGANPIQFWTKQLTHQCQGALSKQWYGLFIRSQANALTGNMADAFACDGADAFACSRTGAVACSWAHPLHTIGWVSAWTSSPSAKQNTQMQRFGWSIPPIHKQICILMHIMHTQETINPFLP